jgi:hypothetical protein
MTGERLLVSHQGEGFSLPRVTEPGLLDLYQWSAALMVNALRSGSAGAPTAARAVDPAAQPIASLEALFAGLAAQSGNGEVERAVAGASDRLHRARRGELVLVPDFVEEVLELQRLLSADDPAATRQMLVAYHRRRLRLAPALVRHLHGLGDREPR